MKFKCKCGSTMVGLTYKTEIDRWKMIEDDDEFPETFVGFEWAVSDVVRKRIAQCEECNTSWVSCTLEGLIEIMKTMGVLEEE